jgi:hypothetical protein
MFYEAQGRRGGHCRQLGVSVRGGWKTCSFASPPFTSSWRSLERLVTLSNLEVAFEAPASGAGSRMKDLALSEELSRSDSRSTRSVDYELAGEESA